MSKSNVDRAVATVHRPVRTDAQKVAVTASVTAGMQASPSWATATAVQTAVTAWSAEAASLDANAKAIAALHMQLKMAEAKQNVIRRDWTVAKSQVMIAVTSFCGGSTDLVKSFTLDVVTRGRVGLLAAPQELKVGPGAVAGALSIEWARGDAYHGFLVQHASDPNTPATISAAIPSTKPKLSLASLVSGATVSCRVAAIDPASSTGMSPWSAWVLGNVK